ncbi:MAG: recombinase family protein [Phycisphaeraceae bacterium]
MLTAHSYARFSSKKQRKGHSEERQTENFFAHCKAKGYATAMMEIDRGVSAWKGKNATEGALARILAAIKDGRIKKGDVLVVESLDRLSREQVLDALHLFTSIIKQGVQVDTISDSYTYTVETVNRNPFDLMYSIMLMSRANEENNTKSKRVLEAWNKKRRNASTTPLSAKAPAWLELVDGKFIFKAKEAATVKRIIDMSLGGAGAPTICKTLNREKVPTLGRAKRWEYSNIRHYLNSRNLLGEYQPCIMKDGKPVPEGEPIKGYYPALLNDKQWYALQGALATRRTAGKGRNSGTIANLFGRLLTSGNDGSTLYLSQKRKENINLVSGDTVKGLAETPSFPYNAFEAHFLQWVSEVRIGDTSPAEGNLAPLQGQLEETRKKIRQVEKQLETAEAGGGFSRLMTLLTKLEGIEVAQQAAIEAEQAKRATPTATGADIAMIAKLATIKPDTILEGSEDNASMVREKLKQAVATVVKSIELYTYSSNRIRRIGVASVTLADGAKRIFAMRVERKKETLSASNNVRYTGTVDFAKLGKALEQAEDFTAAFPTAFTAAVKKVKYQPTAA